MQLPRETWERLTGVYVPTIVPLNAGRELDRQSFQQHIDFLLAGGVHGLWVNGTTGDCHALRDEEQIELVRLAVERCGDRVPVVAHVGDTATRLVIGKARAAREAGATLVSIIPPYFLEFSDAELEQHVRKTAAAIDQPVLLYHNPMAARSTLSIPAILRLVRDGVVVGIKESSSDLEVYRRLIESTRGEGLPLRCFHGAAGLGQSSLSLGGDGLISVLSNVVPGLCVELCAVVHSGNAGRATEVQQRISRLTEGFAKCLRQRPNWAPVVAAYKWVLCRLGVIASDATFDPLEPLSAEEIESLHQGVLPLVRTENSGSLPKPGSSASAGLVPKHDPESL